MKIDQTFPYLQYKGSSTFQFTFTIDFDFYDKGAGGKGSKSAFWFVLNCRTGQIVEFESISEKEKPYIRLPYYGRVESPWSIESYKGEPFRLDIHGPHLEYYSPNTDEVKNIEKTINSSNFRSIANAVLSKIRAHQGDSFIGEDPAEADYWADSKRQKSQEIIQIFRRRLGEPSLTAEQLDEVWIWEEGDELLPFIQDGSLFEALPNLKKLCCDVELSQLPEVLVGVDKLSSLSVLVNQLKLPQNIGALPNLRYLGLSGTIELPENIGEWSHLEKLNLNGWQGELDSLPDSIVDLGTRVELYANDGFSESIEEMSNILNELKPVQQTARRGYIIPENEEADALIEKLKEKKSLFDWLYERSSLEIWVHDNKHLTLLQSQSKSRHIRGVWILENLCRCECEFEVLFLNNGPCESLAFLKKLPDMKVLILDNTKIPDLSPLRHCPDLKEISLRGSISEDFSVLGKLDRLERLVLDGVSQFNDAQILSGLASLKDLDLRGTGIRNVSQIPDLPALETLRLGVSEQPVSLQGIERFSSLKMLDITGSEVQILEKIGQLSNLEKLRIFNAKLSDAKVIEGKTSLKELCLGSCKLSKLAELDISGFTALDHLDLLGTKIKLSGSFQKRLGGLSVDSLEIVKEVIPDVEKEAREDNFTEPDELPPFSVTIGKNLRKE